MRYILLNLFVFLSVLAIGQKNPLNLEIPWKTDTTKTTVSLNSFRALMKPDGIPPIDMPYYYTAEQARSEFFLFEPVIAIEHNGTSKAYPLSVMMYHEIVNDKIVVDSDTLYFSATYCPLCNSAMVFNRKVSHESQVYLLDFGVSGMLRKSDMVMYDRQTESWWQQFTGEALVGKFAGAELNFIANQVITLKEYLSLYPNGQVLSKNTGNEFNYGNNPYVGYDDIGNVKPRLFKDSVDARMPAMERIVDITVKRKHKIYKLEDVAKFGALNDFFNGEKVVIFHTEKLVSVLDSADISKSKRIGAVSAFKSKVDGVELTFFEKKGNFVDAETNSIWNMKGECIRGKMFGKVLPLLTHGQHFAFAMLAFHPECEIFIKE